MKKLLTAALLGTLFAASGQAANVGYASVTGTAGVTNAALAGDGYFPPDETFYQTDTAFWAGEAEEVSFVFSQPYKLDGLKINVDNNDFYRVYISTNGSTWSTYATILAFEGTACCGVETFTVDVPATANAYSFAKVVALAGDGLYSVGELQFTGTAVAAVPEPASLAMLLSGLGVVCVWARRRRGH